jgi:hypothetical protein
MSVHGDTDTPAFSKRVVEIVVALTFIGISAIVMTDSIRVGAGWNDLEGPQAGYFPFRIGLLLALASAWNLLKALRDPGTVVFVGKNAFKLVLMVLIPTTAYVFVVSVLGIYVASTVFIAAFMIYFDRYNPLVAAAVGLGTSVTLFLMFEIWFLVPLQKGPFEAWLGY